MIPNSTRDTGTTPRFLAFKKGRESSELCLLNELLSFTKEKHRSEEISRTIFNKYDCLSNLLNHPLMLERVLSLNTDKSTACLLMLCALAYANDNSKRNPIAKKRLNSLNALAKYAANLYKNEKAEIISLLFVNENMELANSRTLTSNHISYAKLKIRDVLISKPDLKRCGLFLVHNHPNGNCSPSQADTDAYNNLKKRLIQYGITVLDSVIVAKNKVYSIANERAVEV